MMHRRARIALPIALIVLGVWLLAGCVFIPTFDSALRGRNVSKEVGSQKSRRPVRLHTATRDDVIRHLGQPRYRSPDHTRIAYEWDVSNGIWIWPICFTAYRQEGKRALLLTFDDAGILRTTEVLKVNGNWLEPAASRMYGLPHDMRLNTSPGVRTATRPAIRPAPPAGEAP